MTAFTGNVGVRAIKREIGLPIVIEAPLHPVDRVMAGRAVRAEAPVMRVVLAMAINTLGGCIVKDV